MWDYISVKGIHFHQHEKQTQFGLVLCGNQAHYTGFVLLGWKHVEIEPMMLALEVCGIQTKFSAILQMSES